LCLAGHPTSPVILEKFFREPALNLGGTTVVDPNAECPGSLKAVPLGLEEAGSRLVPDHRLVREQFAGETRTGRTRRLRDLLRFTLTPLMTLAASDGFGPGRTVPEV
jgi:hypothetical protein